ncbi:MAG TPA: sugar phosphate isomerase/epimerase family protein [Burkholderiales bacterium]|nr:sugar phosphate isomerase/epimerase family protein [Burkholderiales bacterium]
MSPMSERLALHTWSLDSTPLAQALQAARAGGWNAVELRRIDFTRCFDQGKTNEQVIALVRESGLNVAVLGTEYGLIFAKGDESRRLFDVLEQTCRNARALGCDMIMIAPGQNTGTIKEAAANFRTAGEVVAKHGLRIALEFNSAHDVINRLEVAREVISLAGHPSAGLLLDAYHLERSGGGGRGFEDVAPEEIFTFQFSDVPHGPPSSERRPTDRLVPGQGRVRWNDVFALLAEKRYEGYLSYEAPNPALWSRPPAEVACEAAAAARKFLAQVE